MVSCAIYADHSGCLLDNRLQPERLKQSEWGVRGGERGCWKTEAGENETHFPTAHPPNQNKGLSGILPLGPQAPNLAGYFSWSEPTSAALG